MHKHKIVHRDLKAENIMNHNGTYKIIDLGFSKKLEIAQEAMEIKATALGTITTMAPEVMNKQPYGLKVPVPPRRPTSGPSASSSTR
jgi:serine/threonine protein kinase